MQQNINILSTKKLSQTQRELFSNTNINLIESSFIQTQSIDFTIQKIHENLIFSSQNAVQSILKSSYVEQLKSHKVFCVGIKTKNLLEENGFEVIAYTDYASDLAEIITLVYSDESYTFFCGNLRRDTLPDAFSEFGIQFEEIKVYETTLTSNKISTPIDGILFFSPSGIESFLQQNSIKNEICFCIGETTAEALENTTQNIVLAEQPIVEDVITECINYYNR